MYHFSLDQRVTIEIEQSHYDDSSYVILKSNLVVLFNGEERRTFEVRLIELADSLREAIVKYVTGVKTYQDFLWDTGESFRVTFIDPDIMRIELPIGTSEVVISLEEAKALVETLYSLALRELVAYPGKIL